MIRFDCIHLDAQHRYDASGFLVAPAALTRTGVFPYVYTGKDGKQVTRMELRHPDDVFKADSMATAARRPVVDGHPFAEGVPLVTSENAKRLMVGMVSDEVKQDGDAIVGTVIITDAATIQKVENGKRQLSMGYACKVIPEQGEYNGQRYDARQTEISYNHVAIENRGRMGAFASIRLDGENAISAELEKVWYVFDSNQTPGDKPVIRTKIKFPKVEVGTLRLDEATVEVPAEDAKAVEAIEVSYEQLAKAVGDLQARVKALEGDKATLESDKSKLEGEKAALSSENDAMKADRADVKIHAAAIERAGLIDIAKSVKVDVADTMTNDAIKRAVIAVKAKEIKLDSADAAYVDGVFAVVKSGIVSETVARGKMGQIHDGAAVGTSETKTDADLSPREKYLAETAAIGKPKK